MDKENKLVGEVEKLLAPLMAQQAETLRMLKETIRRVEEKKKASEGNAVDQWFKEELEKRFGRARGRDDNKKE